MCAAIDNELPEEVVAESVTESTPVDAPVDVESESDVIESPDMSQPNA